MKLSAKLCVAVAALTIGQPALACRGVFSHRYVMLETPPLRLPDRAVLLKVSVAKSSLLVARQDGSPNLGRSPVTAKVMAAQDRRLIGRSVIIGPVSWSSCTHWSESERAAYVVGFLVRKQGRLRLIPVQYRSKRYRTPAEDRSKDIQRENYVSSR